MRNSGRQLFFLLFVLALAPVLSAQEDADYNSLARDLLRELIAIKSTESGVGSTPAAEAMAKRFLQAGFAPDDVQVLGPNDRKKNVVVRLHGKGNGKPLLLIAHLDVVEARPEDWSADLNPFQLVERDGYFYGRGTQDIKDGVAILSTNFIRWKREGWVPDRDLILALTADEETGDSNGVAWLLNTHRNLIDAEYCLNIDSGDFSSKDGVPESVNVAAAEKKFAMIQLQTTNRGGHGSLPRKDNAIYELASALTRIERFEFPAMLNEVTRAQFASLSKAESGQVTSDMRAVATNPHDEAALARLSQDPYFNALIRTTCVATMLEGGHAENALPQRAKAFLNCRIIPGHDPGDVLRSIKRVVNDDKVEITYSNLSPVTPPPSKLRPDLMTAVEKTAQRAWPKILIIPTMETGASDSRILRAAGIPAYGVSGVFIDQGDTRSHGRDERVRMKDFYGGVAFYDSLLKELVGGQK